MVDKLLQRVRSPNICIFGSKGSEFLMKNKTFLHYIKIIVSPILFWAFEIYGKMVAGYRICVFLV